MNHQDQAVSRRRSLICLTLTASLLILSFAPFNQGWLAWIALLPFLRALSGRSKRAAFGCGYVTGLIFFSATLYWFVFMAWTAGIPLPLSILAAVCVVLYLSCYFGIFGTAVVVAQPQPLWLRMLWLPSVWVALEFVRDRLFSGFGWLLLGHSQVKFLPMIQIADVTGVFGISFVIVMVNVVVYGLWRYGRWSDAVDDEALDSSRVAFQIEREAMLQRCSVIAVGIVFYVVMYGVVRLATTPDPVTTQQLVVVQGNTDQRQKLMPATWPEIFNRYLDLTRRAAATHPDLVIWPENSFPGYLWLAPDLLAELQAEIARLQVPHLIGAVTMDKEQYHNTAMLFNAQGQLIHSHHKIHLVPFGEYIPLRRQLPFLADLVPVADFARGSDWKPIDFKGRPSGNRESIVPLPNFAVLICFEDTVARLARRFVREGAQLLINITNDAWFGDTPAPRLHWQAAIFRAVENRRELVRAANTGISGFIDRNGRVKNILTDKTGRSTYVDGILSQEVALYQDQTFYTKYGDVFTYLNFGCILIGIIRLRKKDVF